MKINSTPQNNINFRALHISRIMTNVGNKCQTVDLYSLGEKDKDFILNFTKKIDLSKLYPEVENQAGFREWKEIIKSAACVVGSQDTILAVRDKRPCGIMSYETDGEGGINLSYLAKWRTKPNDDTSHMGKIFMHHLLKYAQGLKAEYLKLVPLGVSPRGKSCEKFYESIGFTKMLDDVHMIMPDFVFPTRIAQLENFFEKFRKFENENNQDVNPEKEFILTFEDTLKEKFVSKVNELFEQITSKL